MIDSLLTSPASRNSFAMSLVILSLAGSFGCATGGGKEPSLQSLNPKPSASEIEARKAKYISGFQAAEARASLPCAPPAEGSSPDQAQWLRRLASCVNQKNWTQLESIADGLARSDIESPWPAYFRSISSLELGDHRRALWMIEQALEKVGPNEMMRYQRIRVLIEARSLTEALAEAEALVEAGSRLAPLARFVAQTRDQMGQGPKALMAYQKVLALEPSDRIALARAGDLHWSSGEKLAAVEAYERLISLAPDPARVRDARADLRVAEFYEAQGPEGVLRAIRTLQKLSSDVQKGIARQVANIDLQQRIKSLEERVQPQSAPKQAQTSAEGVKR